VERDPLASRVLTAHADRQEDRLSTPQTPPFRADHVGSLLRPPALTQARADFKAGHLDADGLRAVEDAAILEAIEMQRAVGLKSVTDGELRRSSWHMDFIYQLEGINQVQGESLHVQFKSEQGTYDNAPPAMRVAGRVGLGHTIFADAFNFLRDHAHAGQTPKLTIPSPSMVHYRGGNAAIDRDVYPDIEAFWSDLVLAYRRQLKEIHALGCRYLQLDDTSLAYVNDPAQRKHIEAIGGDPEHLHELYIDAINRVLADKPADLTVTTHLCRGNNQSMWVAEGGYDFVAEALFGELGVNGYFLEFDDERSGTFEPLRYLPKGDKRVILGIVTTKRAELEDKDMLKRRIDEASKYVDIDQLGISGQCGFSSTEEGNKLTLDEQKAKLELIVEVAAEVWGPTA
jgi:5-methyltetrahydropteroyltriglutamate--homocysteine methyltransferase